MHEDTFEELRRNSHQVGTQSAISHEGMLLLSVDGLLMTIPEIYKLLEEDKRARMREML